MEISPPKAFIILGMASERGLIHITALASASQNGVGQECLPKWLPTFGVDQDCVQNDNLNNNDNDNDNNENSVNMRRVTEQDCLHPEQCSIV